MCERLAVVVPVQRGRDNEDASGERMAHLPHITLSIMQCVEAQDESKESDLPARLTLAREERKEAPRC